MKKKKGVPPNPFRTARIRRREESPPGCRGKGEGGRKIYVSRTVFDES